jgi:hypothetical protein
MIVSEPLLTLSEAKNKELVPFLGGSPLHSLHNPRREAEVFASNHLAHLYKSPCALVLGLGFGYHIEEIAKILKLKHKNYRIAVVEAVPELARLVSSYRGALENVEIFTAKDVHSLWNNPRLGSFLLEKPVVIIHPNSFSLSRKYYETFLGRKAPKTMGEWQLPDQSFSTMAEENRDSSLYDIASSGKIEESSAWMRAFWECKHAD